MNGHEKVIELRRVHRRAPTFVFLNDYPCDPGIRGTTATVSTDQDVIQLLDLRFLVGLRVMVCSNSETRAKALAEKCKASGASMVGACHMKPGNVVQDGWTEVWHREPVHG